MLIPKNLFLQHPLLPLANSFCSRKVLRLEGRSVKTYTIVSKSTKAFRSCFQAVFALIEKRVALKIAKEAKSSKSGRNLKTSSFLELTFLGILVKFYHLSKPLFSKNQLCAPKLGIFLPFPLWGLTRPTHELSRVF